MHSGVQRSATGQSALKALPLLPYTSQRRTELLSLYLQLQKRIQELDKDVEDQARPRPQARRLLTHPGVSAVTALATEVFLGDPSRFATVNQVASYIGMIRCEHSSGKRQRLGKLTKEGNSLLRYLWREATMHAVGKDPELKRFYRRKLVQKGMGKARIASTLLPQLSAATEFFVINLRADVILADKRRTPSFSVAVPCCSWEAS